MRYLKLLSAATLASLIASSSPAQMIFEEDFEATILGNIRGQNGWQVDDGALPYGNNIGLVDVVDGLNGLESRILSGLNAIAPNLQMRAYHPVNIAGVSPFVTVTWKAYAQPGAYPMFASHSAGLGLSPGAGSSLGFDVAGGQWVFEARGVTGNDSARFAVAPVLDQHAKFEVVIDRQNLQVYGRYDIGGGMKGETPRFTCPAWRINELINVVVLQDFREPTLYTGFEVDDIQVRRRVRIPNNF
ncbi:MAG: hypothetical protein HZC36_15475 [Armatimonadetes bacterium]|nr:hypothetical protein [Armatimonadota bacterium]